MMTETEKKEEKEKKPKCKKCQSSFGYFKIKDRAWQCRNCGYLDNKGDDEDEIHS